MKPWVLAVYQRCPTSHSPALLRFSLCPDLHVLREEPSAVQSRQLLGEYPVLLGTIEMYRSSRVA